MSRKTGEIALGGMLFALEMVLSFFESFVMSVLTPVLLLPPGVKLGLANIVVMYSLFFISKKMALSLVVLKSFFVLLTRGAIAGALSLSGGLFAIFVMIIISVLIKEDNHFIMSVSGAICHNIGQIIIMSLMLKSNLTLAYAPILLISGLIMGGITAGSLKAVMPALLKLNIKVK